MTDPDSIAIAESGSGPGDPLVGESGPESAQHGGLDYHKMPAAGGTIDASVVDKVIANDDIDPNVTAPWLQ